MDVDDIDSGLSDPDITVQVQFLGTSNCFELNIQSRARISWLKKEIANKLFSGPSSDPDDIRLIHCGSVLRNSDIVGQVIKV